MSVYLFIHAKLYQGLSKHQEVGSTLCQIVVFCDLIDHKRQVSCGQYELLVRNEAHKMNGKFMLTKYIYN